MKIYLPILIAICLIPIFMQSLDASTLGISKDGSHFTIDGREKFLLGMSYYGAMTIDSPGFITADLDDMRKDGFNWIRVWAFWDPGGMNVSVMSRDGALREPYMTKLKSLIRECNKRGMIVDVTLSRGDDPYPADQGQHLACVKTIARELLQFRNVYIDVANERDVRDARYVSNEDVGALISAIKKIDPKRLCTASGVPGSPEDMADCIKTSRCDFIAPHLPRDDGSSRKTKETVGKFISWMSQAHLRRVPIHLQEPFRRDYGAYQPTEDDYYTDALGAVEGGAAGWCLHNGSGSMNGSRRFRSFRMTDKDGRLYEQLDDVELVVARNIYNKIRNLR